MKLGQAEVVGTRVRSVLSVRHSWTPGEFGVAGENPLL